MPNESYADNDRWRLRVNLSESSFSATLSDKSSPETPPRILAEERWEPTDDNGSILSRLESAVYANPTILDDYQASIIIYSSKQLWYPVFSSEDFDEEEVMDDFSEIFRVEFEDTCLDTVDRYSNVYTLVKGLPAFLNRTFPGADIRHILTEMVRSDACPANGMLVNVSEGFVNMVLRRDNKLEAAVSKRIKTAEDAIYFIALLIEDAKVQKDAEVIIDADAEMAKRIADTISLRCRVSFLNHNEF